MLTNKIVSSASDGLDNWLTTAEAARIAGVSQKRILQLTGTVLDSQKVGRDRLIHRHSLESWLRGRGHLSDWRPLTLRELRFKRSEILSLAAGHNVTNVRVFGSIVRDDANANSDIDFIVDMNPQTTAMDIAGLATDLEDALGCRVDILTTRRSTAFLKDAIKHAVAL